MGNKDRTVPLRSQQRGRMAPVDHLNVEAVRDLGHERGDESLEKGVVTACHARAHDGGVPPQGRHSGSPVPVGVRSPPEPVIATGRRPSLPAADDP